MEFAVGTIASDTRMGSKSRTDCGADVEPSGEQAQGEETANGMGGARSHLLLPHGPGVLNGELEETFRRWYPQLRPELLLELKAAA